MSLPRIPLARARLALAGTLACAAALGAFAQAPKKAAPAAPAATPAQQPAPQAEPAAAPAPAAAAKVSGSAAAGKGKVYQCQGCHGIADWKTAFPEVYRVPKLGGQKPEYIVAALRAYKSGERDFATMRGIAADLTDQDMADIAAYYGAGEIKTAERK